MLYFLMRPLYRWKLIDEPVVLSGVGNLGISQDLIILSSCMFAEASVCVEGPAFAFLRVK